MCTLGVGERVGYRVADRVMLFGATSSAYSSVYVKPIPPISFRHERGVVTPCSHPRCASPTKPFHALPDYPLPRSATACVSDALPSTHTYRHPSRRVTTLVLPSFFLKRVSPPAGAVQNSVTFGADRHRPAFGVQSVIHAPPSPTAPPPYQPHQLPRRVAPLPFDPYATMCGRVTRWLGHNRVDVCCAAIFGEVHSSVFWHLVTKTPLCYNSYNPKGYIITPGVIMKEGPKECGNSVSGK